VELTMPTLKSVYVKLSISNKTRQERTKAGITETKHDLKDLFCLMRDEIITKGTETNSNKAVTKAIDTAKTMNFSINGDKLKNDGFVIMNSHSITRNIVTLNNIA